MRTRGHRASREDDSNPLHDAAWLFSYADLMTQLLIFSILMLVVLGLKAPQKSQKDQQRAQRDQALVETVTQVEKFVKESGLADSMAVDRASDRLVIRMKSAILFAEAKASLTPEAERVLAGLAPVLARAPSRLRVEGHTDDLVIRSAEFPSNWELSTARAISVTQYLEDHGIDRTRLSVAGYGEFHPLVANDGPEHRAQNRRVEIVVLGG
ncbi:OmpA/MotB family protein [Anaeromyxobacter oryzisoli]|uniref:OmpA/MotB family protein n=1 Tax=Anaeromyxobacter oryzisoli TaxID=2925408 RepID=UPI001F56089C|nr:flagellar motor protein MotB [Anaeromyxobacter sp. SG63]